MGIVLTGRDLSLCCIFCSWVGSWVVCAVMASHCVLAEEPFYPILPEQRSLQLRSPSQLLQVAVPQTPRPPTVADPQFDAKPRNLTLNEAINITLANSEVVRVLSGVTASTSGRTIYDVAITNTTIDQQKGVFDPTLRLNNFWNQVENPIGIPDPLNSGNTLIGGTQNEAFGFDFGLAKKNLLGGTTNLGVTSNRNRVTPGVFPIDPSDRTSTEFSYTQPLLQGGGKAANQAPIVLARIDTERS